MAQHEGITGFQIGELIVIKSRHLVDHRAFQMHDLIMRKHQDVFFRISISQGEGHQVMVELAEIGIQLHIFKEVMHPAHVPFHGEAQTVILRFSSHLRPGSRLLGNHHRAMVSSPHNAVQMLEELDGLKILVAAVDIRAPLTVFSAVIQIENGGHRVHTETVHMELLDPVEGIGNQEVFHFIFAEIKDLGTPVRMLAFSGICILITAGSVKLRQSVGIFREMRRNPVKNDADLVFVEIVHQIFEISG